MKSFSSFLVFFSLLVPLSSQAMWGSSTVTYGGPSFSGYAPSVADQNAAIVRRMEAEARARHAQAQAAAAAEAARQQALAAARQAEAQAAAQRAQIEATRQAEAQAAERSRQAEAARQAQIREESERVQAETARLRALNEASERHRENARQAEAARQRRLQKQREDFAAQFQAATDLASIEYPSTRLSRIERENQLYNQRNYYSERQPILLSALENDNRLKGAMVFRRLDLRRVSDRLGPELTTYVNEQYQKAEYFSQQAIQYAIEGAPQSTVDIVSGFAFDLAASTGSFVNGFAQGFYQGFNAPIQAARIIYNNPELISHLSRNVIATIESQGIAGAAWVAYRHLEGSVTQFTQEMAYGNAEQRGHALGELGANVLIGIAGGEGLGLVSAEIAGANTAMRGIVAGLREAGASEAFGKALNQGMRASEVIAPMMDAATERMMLESREAVMRNLDVCREVRNGYRSEVSEIPNIAERMLAEGNSEEVVARQVHAMRREIGARYKEMTPEEVRPYIYGRNLENGANHLGPSIEELRAGKPAMNGRPAKPGKTWREIIDSASRPNRHINEFFDNMMEGR